MIDFKGAVFDLDGTLLDSMPIWETVAIDYLKSLGIKPDADIYKAVRSMSIQQACEHFCAVYGLTLSREEITDGINGMIEDFYFHRAPLKTGVKEALELLKSRGVTLCIATATDRYLVEAALRRTGIDGYFGKIFTCTEIGTGKDFPEIFFRAMAFLGTSPAETAVFEDALYAIETAGKLGMTIVALYDDSAADQQHRIKKRADCYYMSFVDWMKDNA
jgi:HAD superfamily hydrolase (TIGR01509 family)